MWAESSRTSRPVLLVLEQSTSVGHRVLFHLGASAVGRSFEHWNRTEWLNSVKDVQSRLSEQQIPVT